MRYLLLFFILFSLFFVKSSEASPAPPITTPNTLVSDAIDQVLPGIQAAHSGGITPIIRVGVHDGGGFENPEELVAFAKALDGKVSAPVYLIAGPNEPESELWASPNCSDGDGACVGPPVAAYMNAIIQGAGGLNNIKLLSPAFNLCSPVFPSLINAMGGANWGGLDGIAVNAYNGTPVGPGESTVNACLASRLPLIPSGLPVIITETGAFDENFSAFVNEINGLNPRVIGALLFNGYGTNAGWTQFEVDSSQIGQLCGGSCRSKRVGVNFATFYTNGDYERAAGDQMAFTLEIIGGSGSGGAVRPTIERLKYPCGNQSLSGHPLRPYPFNPCDPFIPQRETLAFQCGNGLNVNGSYKFENIKVDEAKEWAAAGRILDPNAVPDKTDPYNIRGTQIRDNLYVCAGTENDAIPKICAINRVPFNIQIDLNTAKLPVIGYTEGNLPNKTKLNSYLSWYLQGADWTPENQIIKDSTSDEFTSYLTFSGPVRKLISKDSQKNIRLVVQSSYSDIHNYLLRPFTSGQRMRPGPNPLTEMFSRVPLSSMEDIVGETVVTIISRSDAQPEGVITGVSDFSKNAIRLWIARTGNSSDPTAVSDGRLYMPHLRETYGLSYILQGYGLPKTFNQILDPNPKYGETDWKRRHIIGTPDKNAHQALQDQTVGQITFESPAYAETPTRNTEIIDNPQIIGPNNVVKNSARVDLGPSTDTGHVETGKAPAPKLEMVGGKYVTRPDPAPSTFNGICTISNAIYTPGDGLVDKKGWAIKGRLTYTQVFKYDALPEPNCGTCSLKPGEAECPAVGLPCGNHYRCEALESLDSCTNNCVTNGGTQAGCRAGCIAKGAGLSGTCTPDDVILPTSARVTVMTKTPMVEEIYNRLVAGGQSVLRRFLPQRDEDLEKNNNCKNGEYIKGEFTRVQDSFDKSCIKSVVTKVSYSDSAGKLSDLHPSQQDSIGQSVPAGNAQIYFPYLGSLQDYFLGAGKEMLNLQRLLRPRGMMGSITFLAPDNPNNPGTDFNNPGTCVVPNESSNQYCNRNYLSIFGDFADEMAVICKNESNDSPNALNDNCLNSGSGYTRDYSVGLFQINILAHPNPGWVANAPEAATLRDALNAAEFAGMTMRDAIQDNHPNSCRILNDGLLQVFRTWLSNPDNNRAYAFYIFQNSGMGPWGGTPSCTQNP